MAFIHSIHIYHVLSLTQPASPNIQYFIHFSHHVFQIHFLVSILPFNRLRNKPSRNKCLSRNHFPCSPAGPSISLCRSRLSSPARGAAFSPLLRGLVSHLSCEDFSILHLVTSERIFEAVTSTKKEEARPRFEPPLPHPS